MTLFRGLLLLAALMCVIAFIFGLDHWSAQACIESGGLLVHHSPGRLWLCYHDGRVSIQ